MNRYKKNSAPCGTVLVKDFVMGPEEYKECKKFKTVNIYRDHEFELKKNRDPVCEVANCYNTVYSKRICEFHHILNNETKKCISQICQSNRNGKLSRCKECDIIVTKLDNEFSELGDKMHEIVREMNSNYARDFNDSIYFC